MLFLSFRQKYNIIMATKSVKKAAKNTVNTTENNLAKIKKTAQKVNAEVQETANYIANDLMENGQAVRDTAVKAAEKIDLSDSVKKLKKTAEKINTQVTDTTVEVTDAMLKSGKKLTDTAAKKVQTAVEKIDLKSGVQKVGTTAKKVNAYSLETAEEMVEGAKKNGAKWNKTVGKAIDGGLKLGAQQQDMVFDTLEAVKKQMQKNSSRFFALFTKN